MCTFATVVNSETMWWAKYNTIQHSMYPFVNHKHIVKQHDNNGYLNNKLKKKIITYFPKQKYPISNPTTRHNECRNSGEASFNGFRKSLATHNAANCAIKKLT